MRAYVSRRYGGPEVMHLEEVAEPIPGENEVLIDVRGVSVNPYDWHYLRGMPKLTRLSAGLLRPKRAIIGADLAGVVVAVGPKVTRFRPGDEVFGACTHGERMLGAFAQRVCATQDQLAEKPVGISFDEAATLPIAGLTALQALRDGGRLRAGQRVLVNGASGGVGTYAVQIAKAFGAHVTGVSSAGNHDMVRSIGADEMIDYHREDFTASGERHRTIRDAVASRRTSKPGPARTPGGILSSSLGVRVNGAGGVGAGKPSGSVAVDEMIDPHRDDGTSLGTRYDVICDTVGNHSASELKRALTPGGVAVVVGFTSIGRVFAISMQARKGPKPGGRHVGFLLAKTTAEDLEVLADLVESGRVSPVIDRRYPFEELPRAIDYIEGGHARGKVAVTL